MSGASDKTGRKSQHSAFGLQASLQQRVNDLDAHLDAILEVQWLPTPVARRNRDNAVGSETERYKCISDEVGLRRVVGHEDLESRIDAPHPRA